jgi:hypothetical protein
VINTWSAQHPTAAPIVVARSTSRRDETDITPYETLEPWCGHRLEMRVHRVATP